MNKEEEKKLQEMAKEVISQAKQSRKIIKLHHLPDSIKKSIEELRDMCDEESMRFLFDDIYILVGWALDRLPILPPNEKEKDGE